MPTPSQCLEDLNRGDQSALSRLFPLVYDELRLLAGVMLKDERAGHTLQPTALVHEAYVRLIEYNRMDWRGKAHFFAIAAQAIRRVLIDHSRSRRTERRGGDRKRITLSDAADLGDGGSPDVALDLLDLNDALERLAALSPRQARIVELRFFGGLSNEDVAHVLSVSRKTVVQNWGVARAWMSRELRSRPEERA
jgi:RNA polymerase sigma-70 factor, ECF subfamily